MKKGYSHEIAKTNSWSINIEKKWDNSKNFPHIAKNSINVNMKNKEPKENQPLSFEGQRDDEKLLFIFRRHMISMRKGFYLFIMPLIITAIPPLVWSNNIGLFLLPIAGLLLGLILFAYHFILWYFTIYIVTDQRIRQSTQRGFFGKDVIDLRLSKIQTISYNVPGLSGDLFHFGTIIIHTFVGDLVIHNVEHPVEIYNKLQDAVNNLVQTQGDNEEID